MSQTNNQASQELSEEDLVIFIFLDDLDKSKENKEEHFFKESTVNLTKLNILNKNG